MTHICVGKLTIIDSDNGLSPGRRQAIIWTNAGILLIGPLGTYFNEILIGIQPFSFKKTHLKMSFAKWRSLCLGLNVVLMVLFSMYCCQHAWLSYDLNVNYGWSWSGCHADNRHCTFTNGPDNMVVGKLWKPDENLERSKPIDVLMVKHVRSRQRPRWIMFTLRVNESRIYIGCKSSHGLGLLATNQGPVSISDQTFYHEISQCFEGGC